ncbi:mitotic checkpoint regulator, MAD2B-interacting-domain-containing protein [Podospora aff. communis PSN243]|uniref:Mitotic checkpoint regulator, MAD2B-interacting-domain-containing protein n=1 Tax=Podospora aff. communis PSN243 TaxID=3040156 RepID=A0AAV9H5Y6_9PEZI|nr:mitotic checkpoint regulator, MAD2B-interacting-domain-containing protein [Podospora aff. communis PSN243]
MALVDYSDSDSDSDSDSEPNTTLQPPPKAASASTTTNTKKPFQKLIDRSGPTGTGKIIVSLPTASDTTGNTADEPPAKRAKTASGAGTSRFSAFSSFLPAPKKNAATAPTPGDSSTPSGHAGGSGGTKKGISLKTGAEASFARREEDEQPDATGGGSGGLNLPAPKKGRTGPTIPEGQKPEAEVKLVGKPLMFKPLSVTRKPAKKKTGVMGAAKAVSVVAAKVEAPAPAPPRKVSLFSMDDDDDDAPRKEATTGGAYEPLFATDTNAEVSADGYDDDGVTGDYESYVPPPAQENNNYHPTAQFQSASSIVDGLQLSEKAQRELFGRRGGANRNNEFALPANARVLNFNMEKEYEHNEALRASGEQVYNPVRSIAPGKHSLRQMVNMAQNNQSALEDSFAQGKNNRKDAAGRYGWK